MARGAQRAKGSGVRVARPRRHKKPSESGLLPLLLVLIVVILIVLVIADIRLPQSPLLPR